MKKKEERVTQLPNRNVDLKQRLSSTDIVLSPVRYFLELSAISIRSSLKENCIGTEGTRNTTLPCTLQKLNLLHRFVQLISFFGNREKGRVVCIDDCSLLQIKRGAFQVSWMGGGRPSPISSTPPPYLCPSNPCRLFHVLWWVVVCHLPLYIPLSREDIIAHVCTIVVPHLRTRIDAHYRVILSRGMLSGAETLPISPQ